MNQFLSIFGDVMRIATFQWHGERRPYAGRCEEGSRWSASAGRYPVRRSRP
ncbi:hypothetical protein LHFGNBLO_003622 [Mesorhizobium sp. AR10]|uniref:hypothetical protein n=1 Tax=Mesorhizobium sp. AR10 TaxID=2865839 RepID=UPI00215FEF6F|nr:hypothetical protein [Mesorhizobium sp. AR10]UVK36669.1 hypothetical protein LHFGNBLO_003622 [Mesorhizobium sp. AR10]